jgi:uncharacterized membrane protein YidH (DUF202 family)
MEASVDTAIRNCRSGRQSRTCASKYQLGLNQGGDVAQYYVRRGNEGRFEGPWDETEIRGFLASGELAMDAEAVEATGQTSYQLKSSQAWQKIANLALLSTGVVVDPAARSKVLARAAPSASAGLSQASIIAGVVGILLFVFGAIQWSSAESQLRRAFGQTDGLGLFLFLAGGASLLYGVLSGLGILPGSPSGSTVASPSPPVTSVEERLRLLDELRSKQLLSDSEYEQKKRDIIGSL